MAGLIDRKKDNNIKHVKINGESGEVSGATVDSWKERLPELLKDMQVKTFGILMKLLAFGVLFLTMDFAKLLP